MQAQVWVLCVALSFCCVFLSASSEGKYLYNSPTEFDTKREAKHGLMVDVRNAGKDEPPYIPPNEFGKKREIISDFMVKVRNAGEGQPPYIPPNEFGKKREIISDFMGNVANPIDVEPPYIPPNEFGRKRESRHTSKEKLDGLRLREEQDSEIKSTDE